MPFSPYGQKWHPWASGDTLRSLLINTKKTAEVECPAFEQRLKLRTGDLREIDSKVEVHLSPRWVLKEKTEWGFVFERHPLIRQTIWFPDLKDLSSGPLGKHVSHLLCFGFPWFRSCPVENYPIPPSTLPQTLDSTSLLWINTERAESLLLQAPAVHSWLPASVCCCPKSHCPSENKFSSPSLFPISSLPPSFPPFLAPSLPAFLLSFLYTFGRLSWAMAPAGVKRDV